MRKKLCRSIAVAAAAAMAVTAVPLPAQAAKAAKVKLSVSNCVLSLGDKIDLDIVGAKEAGGKYTTANKKVASVTKKGVVTAKKTGNTKITWKRGTKKYTCKVKVVKAPVLSKSKVTLEEGKSIKVSVKNYGNKKLSVKWSSSDEGVAKVSGGKITGISAGEATIQAKMKGYKKTWKKSIKVTVQKSGGQEKPPVGEDIYKGYHMVWEDQFNGSALNKDDWNIELHEPGWVNNELQEYTDSEKNIYIEDGNLVLKPIKTVGSDGKVSYTSGRVNTQNKHDFKYGLFEARLKVPAGQGFLPAFWMMPTNENLYGQWPRCGEIDIMEVLGSDTKTAYGTIHYGYPHSESQGNYKLESGSFSEEYHTYSVEWEPGKIKWYVDGILFHTEDDWYSTVAEDEGEVTYPAPFDQPFYMILNLAVGGNWPGNPDDTTDIDNAAFKIDYVKAYQKDSYNEDVEKPVKEVVLRDPDKDGNYINNGTFAEAEDLADEKNWAFLTTNGGVASAEIKDNQIAITTTNAGTADYSVQLVQPDLPMKQGATYKVSFDAYADQERTMKVDVSAPDRGYKRYLEDTVVELKKEKQTYTYEFTMKGKDDANGRLEYNLGNTASTAGVYISNVSVKKIAESPVGEQKKTVLSDGNYVYNGGFQEGKGRLGFWDVTNTASAEVSVTNTDNIRKLKVVAPEGTSADKPVIISQPGLAIQGGNQYALSFAAEGEANKKIAVTVAGQKFDAELSGANKEYNYKITTESNLPNKDIAFRFEQPGTYYLDDVRLVEDSLIKNGSFNAGFAGYEPFIDGSASATYVVDSQTEDNAADFSIENTGDAAWKIQLKQNNVELEKDQWYRISLKAKSSIARKLMFAIQRDGSSDDDWTPYSGEKIVELSNEYQIYDIVFQMKNETDLKAVLSISMGAVDGVQITEKHRICIDDINLEKVDAPEVPTKPEGENMLLNPDFAEGDKNWENAVTAPGEAKVSFEGKKAVYEISNVGTADWNVQLKQSGITLEKGSKYKVSFKAASTEERAIKVAMLSAAYDWYGGADIALSKEEKLVEFEFVMEKDTDANTIMVVSMGKIDEQDTPLSMITLSDFTLEKVS